MKSILAYAVIVLAMSRPAYGGTPTKEQCVAANEDAQELRHAGKLQSARSRLAICLSQGCPGPVREDCAQRFAEIEIAMPTVVFEAKDGSGNGLTAVRVTMDGKPLLDRLDGSATNIDPGDHLFVFSADGLPTVERRVVVQEREKEKRLSVVMATSETTKVVSDATQPLGSTQRTFGLLVVGAGIVGVAIGTVFGLASKATYDSALSLCDQRNPSSCSDQAIRDGQAAHRQAAISTVGFVAGGALLAGGTLIYLTAPIGRSTVVGPTIGTTAAGITLRGTW